MGFDLLSKLRAVQRPGNLAGPQGTKWLFPKIRGLFFGRPCNKDPKNLGSVMGLLIFGLASYPDLQRLQNNGPDPKVMGIWAILLGTLEVQVAPRGPNIGRVWKPLPGTHQLIIHQGAVQQSKPAKAGLHRYRRLTGPFVYGIPRYPLLYQPHPKIRPR